jgi:adenylate kinase
MKNKDCVMLFGVTGAGKSTAINSMVGKTARYKIINF